MSFKDKKNNDMEKDDMNIKSHLNTSLDLNKIKVSEDLINRTLEAIRLQSSVENSKKEDDLNAKDVQKKIIPWNRYIRGFAGVAAAVLIVFVGYNVMKNFPDINIGLKKDSNTAEDNSFGNSKAQEAPQSEIEYYTLSEDETTSMAAPDAGVNSTEASDAAVSDYTITGNGTIGADQELKYGSEDTKPASDVEEETAGSNTSDSTKVGFSIARDSGESRLFSFQDICVLAPEQLSSVTITSKDKGTTISLTDQIGILDFYSMMDKHTFSFSTESSVNQNYTVDLISPKPEEALYTMWVGENVTVRFMKGEETMDNTYKPTDYETFKADLDKFFEEYSQ